MAPLPRLIRRAEFLKVAAARRKFVAPGLILQAAGPSQALASPAPAPDASWRVGFTASRKVGNAVARNRARRRLRAVSAAVLPAHALAGHDFVLIARAGTLTRPYPALIGDLEEGLKRLGAYRA
jgi:ribonuclease P protein component